MPFLRCGPVRSWGSITHTHLHIYIHIYLRKGNQIDSWDDWLLRLRRRPQTTSNAATCYPFSHFPQLTNLINDFVSVYVCEYMCVRFLTAFISLLMPANTKNGDWTFCYRQVMEPFASPRSSFRCSSSDFVHTHTHMSNVCVHVRVFMCVCMCVCTFTKVLNGFIKAKRKVAALLFSDKRFFQSA